MKIVRKIVLLISIVLLTNSGFSQPFTVDFSGELSGSSVTLESVEVQNLTKNTSITLQSGFVLDLVSTLVVDDVSNQSFNAFPNPFFDKSYFEFYVDRESKVSISIIDELGRNVYFSDFNAQKGLYLYEFQAKDAGLYMIYVFGENIDYKTKVICNVESSNRFNISRIGEAQLQKSEQKNNPQLLYELGDQLVFTGNYSNYSTVIAASPTQNEPYLFDFQMCIDYDNNVYPVVHLGTQWWMAENLKTTHYANGNSVTSYVYDNNSANEDVYGRLYSWLSVMNGADGNNNNPSGVQGVCPDGWHVPSEAEWDKLRDVQGGWAQLHGSIKEVGVEHWNAPNSDATNSSGMNVLPAGLRWGDDGTFDYLHEQAFFWNTSNFDDLEKASGYTFFNELPSDSYYIYIWNLQSTAMSVRCVMD